MATRQQGEKKGKVVGLVVEEKGVDNSDAHHSQVCVQTLVRFWKKKRVALQRPSPPASHPPPPQVCLCSWATYGLEEWAVGA